VATRTATNGINGANAGEGDDDKGRAHSSAGERDRDAHRARRASKRKVDARRARATRVDRGPSGRFSVPSRAVDHQLAAVRAHPGAGFDRRDNAKR